MEIAILVVLCIITGLIIFAMLYMDERYQIQNKKETTKLIAEYDKNLSDNQALLWGTIVPFARNIKDLWKYKVRVGHSPCPRPSANNSMVEILIYPKFKRMPKAIISDDPNEITYGEGEENNLMWRCELQVAERNYDFLKDLCKESFRPAEIIFEL